MVLSPARSDQQGDIQGALCGSFAACADKEDKVIFTGSESVSFASVDARNLIKERKGRRFHGIEWCGHTQMCQNLLM